MKSGPRIMTLNVHFLKPIVLMKPSEVLEEIYRLVKHYDVDVCFMQEFFDDEISVNFPGYSFLRNERHNGLVALYKSNLDFEYKYHILLPRYEKRRFTKRFAVFFRYGKLWICMTHLEIGERYKSRAGNFKMSHDLRITIDDNQAHRKLQMEAICRKRPDIIIGDFNFESDEPEFEYTTSQGYETTKHDYTTPFGSQVDWVFDREGRNVIQQERLNFAYSDHLPILAVLDPSTVNR